MYKAPLYGEKERKTSYLSLEPVGSGRVTRDRFPGEYNTVLLNRIWFMVQPMLREASLSKVSENASGPYTEVELADIY